jgi:uncharacterized membrane protein YqhA
VAILTIYSVWELIVGKMIGMKLRGLLKHLSMGKYELYLVGIIVFALALRFVLIALNWPATNSDEGNMGVLARHVAYNSEWPIFFYGQVGELYVGPVEGYVSALLFRVFGSSLFILRLGLLPFYALFLVCMYGLTCLLQTKAFAIFSTLLFSFGAGSILFLQLRAVGEYPETEFFAAAICLIVVWLALSRPLDASSRRLSLLRSGVYGVLGLLIGLAMWVDLLILPFVCMGILFLLLFCRREVFSRAGLSLLLGMIIGLLPLIIYNLQVPFAQGSIAELLDIHGGKASSPRPFLVHLVGTFGISLPEILNYNPACQQSTFPFFGKTDVMCGLLQASWGAGYLVLCALAAVISLSAVWTIWRSRTRTSFFSPVWTFEQRQRMIRECGRLMMLVCALGTLLLYLTSSAVATTPGPTSRYLIGLLISVPTVLWPLWNGLRPLHRVPNAQKIIARAIRFSLLALVLGMFVSGTYRIFVDDLPVTQITYRQQLELVQHLKSLNAQYVYSEYWTCNNLIFLSNEAIICSSLDEKLHRGNNRYLSYQSQVEAAPHPTYLFPRSSVQAQTFEQDVKRKMFVLTYQRTYFNGYVIYSPQSAAP